jgi:hypothetical protein
MFEMKNKKHEIEKENSYPVNPVHPVKKKMSDTTEIVTRLFGWNVTFPFRRVNAAVQTGGRSRSDGWSRKGFCVQTGVRQKGLFKAMGMRKVLEYKCLKNSEEKNRGARPGLSGDEDTIFPGGGF